MVNLLPSWPNALNIPAEDIALNSLEFSEILKSCGGCRFLVLPECGDFFKYTSYFKLPHKYTSFVLYGRTFNSFVALLADLSETLVSWDSRMWDLLGEVSSLAPISSNFSSVSRFHFLSGFLSSSDPVVFSLLTKLCVLCLLGNRSPGNGHRNILRHFIENSYLK